ncbi:hypothetical protein J3R74_003524 [Puniceicoccus vermicola]
MNRVNLDYGDRKSICRTRRLLGLRGSDDFWGRVGDTGWQPVVPFSPAGAGIVLYPYREMRELEALTTLGYRSGYSAKGLFSPLAA